MFDDEVLIKDLSNLPEDIGLYGVFKGNNCIYIGISWNLKRRFYRHNKINEFYEHGAEVVKYKIFSDIALLHDTEFKILKEKKPILNILIRRQAIRRPGGNEIPSYGKVHWKECECTCEIHKIVFDLTWEYILSGKTKLLSIQELSKATGLGTHWLEKFIANPNLNASVNRVETLFTYFTGQNLVEFLENR